MCDRYERRFSCGLVGSIYVRRVPSEDWMGFNIGQRLWKPHVSKTKQRRPGRAARINELCAFCGVQFIFESIESKKSQEKNFGVGDLLPRSLNIPRVEEAGETAGTNDARVGRVGNHAHVW